MTEYHQSLSIEPELGVLTRHPNNPVLTRDDVPYPAMLVFNAGVCKFQGRYVSVFRNDHGRWGDDSFDGTNLGLATSDDGVAWRVSDRPCIDLEHARRLVADWFDDPDRELLRFYDPRLTTIDGRIAMCFAVDTVHGLRGGVALTDDLEQWRVVSLSLPDNRNFVLFPERVGGRYVRLERPMLGYYLRRRYDVWSSSSPDLSDWGASRLVLPAERVPFSNDKIGPAAPPVRTDRGWLTTFHGVWVDHDRGGPDGWEPVWNKVYYAGVMLLDLDEPSRVVSVARRPLLSPTADYETGRGGLPGVNGFRNHVIFPGGMLLEPDGELKLYYGAADSVECLATCAVDDLLRVLDHDRSR